MGKIPSKECNGNRDPFSDIPQRVLQPKNLENAIFLSLLQKDVVIGKRELYGYLQDRLVFNLETDFSPHIS